MSAPQLVKVTSFPAGITDLSVFVSGDVVGHLVKSEGEHRWISVPSVGGSVTFRAPAEAVEVLR